MSRWRPITWVLLIVTALLFVTAAVTTYNIFTLVIGPFLVVVLFIIWAVGFGSRKIDEHVGVFRETLASIRRECPFCKEQIRKDANVCPHCQRESEPQPLRNP